MNESGNNNKLSKKENIEQIAKFFVFSMSAGAIQAGSFTLMTEFTDWVYWPRYLIALILSVLWNFTLNREFTFQSANNVPLAMLKVAIFYAIFTPITTLGGNALSLRGVNEYLILFGTMTLNLTSEFLYDRFFVFKDSINTNKRAQKKQGGHTK